MSKLLSSDWSEPVYLCTLHVRTSCGLAEAFADREHSVVFAALRRPSGMLAEAIMRGEAADDYMSANVTLMWRLQRARMVRHWATLARNRLCLITRSDLSISRLEELATRGLGVVARQAQTDPCGRYVGLLWRRTGVLGRMRAKQAVGELVRSVGSGASKEVQGYARP